MGKNKKWKSQFIVVALGQAISMLGSQGVQFALIWWLAEKTSSPLMLGISGIVAYLPMSLFSPIAGIAADRYNRKFISIFSDMTMGMIALIYAVLLFFLDLPVWTVFVMLCVRGIGQYISAACNTVNHSTARAKRPACKNKWLDAVVKFWLVPAWSSYRSVLICDFSDVSRIDE